MDFGYPSDMENISHHFLFFHEKEICFSTFEVKVEYLSGGTESSLPRETKNKIIMFSNYIWFKISYSY